MLRFRIMTLVVLVGVVALGLAAMRDASQLAERITFSIMVAALVVSWFGAKVRKPDPAWSGFAMFATVYAALAFFPPITTQVDDHLITNALVNVATDQLLAVPPTPDPPAFSEAIRVGASGRERLFQGAWVAMTPEEEKIDAAYNKQLNAHWDSMRELGPRYESAHRIGHAMLVLVFGLVGSLLGPWLACWRRERELGAPQQPQARVAHRDVALERN